RSGAVEHSSVGKQAWQHSSAELPHCACKLGAAMCIATKPIQTSARRGEEDSLTGACGIGCALHGVLHIGGVLERAHSCEHLRDLRSILTDQHDVPYPAAKCGGERSKILALALSARDEHQRARHTCHCGERRTNVRSLGV